MKLSSTLAIFGLAAMAACSQLEPRNYDANDYYVLELDPSTSPDLVAARLGLRHEGQMTGFEGYHIFAGTKEPHDVVTPVLRQSRRRKRTLGGSDILEGVRFAQRQVPRKPWEKRSILPGGSHFPSDARRPENSQLLQKQRTVMGDLGITDPIFEDQWHLLNTVQPGHDLNVTGLWMEGITGHNSTVAIVDDGLDMYSDDLSPNYYAGGSYDFNDHHAEPKPMLADDRHGTRCAGEVAAAKNHVCGVGVAYDAKIAGLRILSKLISDADEAMAMIYDFQNNDIYSCSWGPPDDGRSMDAPGILIKRAMLKGIQEGRGGLGSIYVFASGNGANHDDNCNFDGYTNSIYSITVGAIDRTGQHPYYSERCSAQLVVTYSSGAGDSIVSLLFSFFPFFFFSFSCRFFCLIPCVTMGLTWAIPFHLAHDRCRQEFLLQRPRRHLGRGTARRWCLCPGAVGAARPDVEGPAVASDGDGGAGQPGDGGLAGHGHWQEV